MEIKKRTVFNFIEDITVKKTSWEDISIEDRKAFSPFMINRILSMNPDYVELVGFLQQYTVGQLKPEHVYKLYSDLLPKKKLWNKYIKSSGASDKFDDEIVELFRKNFKWSKQETLKNLHILVKTNPKNVNEYLQDCGFSEDKIKKAFKIKSL